MPRTGGGRPASRASVGGMAGFLVGGFARGRRLRRPGRSFAAGTRWRLEPIQSSGPGRWSSRHQKMKAFVWHSVAICTFATLLLGIPTAVKKLLSKASKWNR